MSRTKLTLSTKRATFNIYTMQTAYKMCKIHLLRGADP